MGVCLISIIMPAYNAEKWAEKIMTQLSEQADDSIQLIMVDDGSTDNTQNISVDRWEKIILEKNSGLSHARNVGISHAKGKYIAFVDSDDEVKPNYIEMLKRNIGHDLVCFKYYTEDGLSPHPKSHQPVWAFMFKRELLSDHSFDETLNVGEDYTLLEPLLEETKDVFYANDAGYFYRWSCNPDSLCKRYNRGEIPFKKISNA